MSADRPDREGASGEAAPRTEAALRWMRAQGTEANLLLEVGQRVRARRRRQRVVRSACAAGSLAIVAAVLAWRGGSPPVPAPERTDLARIAAAPATATVLAPRREVLPDGSIVELKDGAAIAPAFAADLRAVTLLRGEAHFQVTKDPARPFVVRASGVAVRAVGTAFSVQLGSGAVEVLVSEGRVAVERAAGTTAPVVAQPALLERGGLARVALDGERAEVSAVTPGQLTRRLAWRVPQLEFSQTPLPEIVRLMNEHGGETRLVMDLPEREAAEIKLSGLLAADNLDGLAGLLEANFPLRAERVEGGLRLRRRP